MNVKKLLIATVAGFFLVPAFAAAYTYSPNDYPNATETLVEGHTVFAVIQADICVNDDAYQNATPCPNANKKSFDVSYDARANATLQRMGAAVAVLVRDRVKEVAPPTSPPTCGSNKDLVTTIFYENPGVLWFNDQFLVGDDLDLVELDVDANVDVCAKQVKQQVSFAGIDYTYPCGGWVWATQAGNPDPRQPSLHWTYEESYYITDPNDKVWVIDKFRLGLAGTADLLLNDTLGTPTGTVPPADDGFSGAGAPPQDETADNPDQVDVFGFNASDDDDGPGSGYDEDDDADHDLRAVVGPAPVNGAPIQYYLGQFNLWIVPVYFGGQVNPDGTTGQQDTTGPAARTTATDCDAYVDGAGGKAAHDPYPLQAVSYNAVLFFFFEDLRPNGEVQHGNSTSAAGKDNADYSYCEVDTEWDCTASPHTMDSDDDEGNSHPYNVQEQYNGPIHDHLTAGVDLYFHNVLPPPVASRLYAVYDAVGDAAPRHEHDDGVAYDDRMRIGTCVDADARSVERTDSFNGGSYSSSSASYTNASVAYGSGANDPYADDADNGVDCAPDGYDGGVTGSAGEDY